MADGRLVQHQDEAIVLRTWPFHEADLLVSLFTRAGGKVKGVARHAMRSRRRFGGALEPGTHVRAQYAERPKQELMRLDAFEIVWSPLSAPVDALRLAAMQLVVEVLDEAMPEGGVEDNVFRLAVTVLRAMGVVGLVFGGGSCRRAHISESRCGAHGLASWCCGAHISESRCGGTRICTRGFGWRRLIFAFGWGG